MTVRGEAPDRPRTVLMGAGNILLGDDGVGVHVIRILRKEGGLPDDVELIDAGTATLDALPLLEDAEHLVIIDAVKGGGPAGSIYLFTPDDVDQKPSRSLSLHQIGLLDALRADRLLTGRKLRTTIIGVEPGEMTESLDLSPAVKDRIPEILRTVTRLASST